MTKSIRPIVICIFYNDGRILASEGFDKVANKKYFRPIGGGIEFGETSQAALIREIKEELNTEVSDLKQIGIFENIFTYLGEPGHEIVYVYDGKFIDKKFYSEPIFGSEEGKEFEAAWVDIEDLAQKKVILYPAGLTELILNKYPGDLTK